MGCFYVYTMCCIHIEAGDEGVNERWRWPGQSIKPRKKQVINVSVFAFGLRRVARIKCFLRFYIDVFLLCVAALMAYHKRHPTTGCLLSKPGHAKLFVPFIFHSKSLSEEITNIATSPMWVLIAPNQCN